MKKYLFFLASLFSLTAFGQQAGDVFGFVPFANSRIHSSDSVQIQFQLSTNNPATAKISNVVQTGGPTVKLAGASTWITGANVNYAFWLQGLAPGTYTFTATGTSGSGTTGTQAYSLTVVPDQVCPVIPVARTVTAISITINGQLISIPLAGTKITYSDGTNQ